MEVSSPVEEAVSPDVDELLAKFPDVTEALVKLPEVKAKQFSSHPTHLHHSVYGPSGGVVPIL